MAPENPDENEVEEYIDSPSQRLYDLLIKFNGKANGQTVIKKVWTDILGVDATDDPVFFKRYADVLALAPKAYDELRRAGDILSQGSSVLFVRFERWLAERKGSSRWRRDEHAQAWSISVPKNGPSL